MVARRNYGFVAVAIVESVEICHEELRKEMSHRVAKIVSERACAETQVLRESLAGIWWKVGC